MKQWTPAFSLKYMTSHSDEFYLEKIQHRFDIFNVKEVCKSHFGAFKNIGFVADIGSGIMGGALAIFPYGSDRTIIDLNAPAYVESGKLPRGVIAFENDFDKLVLIDNSHDVVFSWECLDHALTEDHFDQGQIELARILKPGGLLFFYLPLRDKPKDAHTIIRTEDEIIKKFEDLGLELKSKEIELDWNRYEKALYAIFEKSPLD